LIASNEAIQQNCIQDAMTDLLNIFHGANLYRWSAASLDDVKISQASKEFLMSVGLPKNSDWTLRFGSNDGTLARHLARPTLRVIGHDDDVTICLDELANGRVIAVEPKRTRFINSSVVQFGSCLALYQSYRLTVRGMDDDGALTLIEEIERKIRTVDNSAFNDIENWWPVIVEHTKSGML
jgi:hypothetical protein